MNEETTVAQVAPTQAEAVQAGPEQFTDKDTVAMVQRLLLAKGHVYGGTNGVLGQKTKDEILSFRARNNLQMIPTIDRDLIKALENAPDKSLPVEQVTATTEQISPKVQVVAVNTKVQLSTWWTKLWAWLTALPSGLIVLAGFAIENIDSATATIRPLRNLLSNVQNVNPLLWIGLIGFTALLMGYQAMTISKLSKKLENAAVGGYQRGTLTNDVPSKEA